MTTIAVVPTPVVAPSAAQVGWRGIAKVFWLERRGTLIGFAGLLAAFAIATVIGEHTTASAYGRYVSDGCVQHPGTYACVTNDFANNSDFIPSLRIAGDALPILIGMFLGAPLLAREYESGTFRFTWTQAVGRQRFVIRTLVLAALVAAAFGIVTGLLLDWVNHPFEVVAHTSQWTAGNFDAAPLLMAAWCVFGLLVGGLCGAVIGRTVAAIAAASAALGGLAIGATVLFVHWLLAIGAVVASSISPITNPGMVNQASMQGQGFPGSWFVRAWYLGPRGNLLSNDQVMRIEAQMYSVKAGDVAQHAGNWLSTHHDVYSLAYQPHDRFWLFQLAAIAVLLVISAVLVAATTWVVDRRRA